MKKTTLSAFFFLLAIGYKAQSPGDTIFVKAFKYGSATRDTVLNFPDNPALSFEKIIMKYNMRCKNNLVSTGSDRNKGCGEWDYSCNTFVVDSSRVENELNSHPSHVISAFTGTNFNYVTQPVFDYYAYSQNSVTLNSITSENQYTVATGLSTPATMLMRGNQKSGRSQLLYTAAELISAGFSAGNIDGMLLDALNTGNLNFFKLGIRHTTLTVLNPGIPTLTGFTNVYNQALSFSSIGSKRIQFHTPFVWDGTSNLLLDFSFTNTMADNAVTLAGSSINGMAMYANNNYALDLSATAHSYLNNAQLSSINTQLSITFWAYGHPAQIANGNSILYGVAANPNQRQLNIHLPWNNNTVYFDCGYANNDFDRIQASTTATAQGGQWNHWAFTKNATTGLMRIYLNGTLWLSGTAKNRNISLTTLILGNMIDFQNNYKGKINELTIWNQALTASDVLNYMNRAVDPADPNFTNMVAYYKMDEGTGTTLNDSRFNLTSTGVNVQWTYDRGHQLTRMFLVENQRPNVVFLRGNYSMSTSTVSVMDSVARNPNIVQQYSITNNANVTPLLSDAVVPTTISYLYNASPSQIYNGDTGVLTGSTAISPTGNITITGLPYYKRYPYYNELLSFVTPYGIGVNLGPNGKSWYYDMTDFSPLLKGSKRFLMTMGGEYQEQMDIDFWFIVGTPPRNVLEFNQLWQGGARLGGVSIGNITNDTRFTNSNVPLLSNGQSFKLRSTITGHGAEGEFSQNGGQVTHRFNVNGGTPEFNWTVTQNCTKNVIFPQGGTWVYNRQGWCPGETSLMKEYDLTSYVTAGTTVNMDYTTSNPPNPGGDYRYIVANQLVTYGATNHVKDACLVEVLAPTNRVLYSRKNPICSDPVVLVRNTGSSALTSMEIDYWINGNTNSKLTYTWTGNLAFNDTVSIQMPGGAPLFETGILSNGNMFFAEIKTVNGSADDYVHNNIFRSAFTTPDVLPQKFTVEFKTNSIPSQNTYALMDDAGNVMDSQSFTTANSLYSENYMTNGCYKIIVEDAGGDGLSWWANPSQGTGYIRIKNAAGQVLKTFEPDFGGGFEYNFTTADLSTSITKNLLDASFNLYPNPAHDAFVIQGLELQEANISMVNVLGQSVNVPFVTKNMLTEFNTSSLEKGVYFITITKDKNTATRKVVIH